MGIAVLDPSYGGYDVRRSSRFLSEDEPGNVHDQEDEDRDDHDKDLARYRYELGAPDLNLLGTILNTIDAFALLSDQLKLFTLQLHGFGMPFDLKPLIVAYLFEGVDEPFDVLIVHRLVP